MAVTRHGRLSKRTVRLELDNNVLKRRSLGRQRKKFDACNKQAVSSGDRRHARNAEDFHTGFAVELHRKHTDFADREWLVRFETAAGSAQVGDSYRPRSRDDGAPWQIVPWISVFHDSACSPDSERMRSSTRYWTVAPTEIGVLESTRVRWLFKPSDIET